MQTRSYKQADSRIWKWKTLLTIEYLSSDLSLAGATNIDIDADVTCTVVSDVPMLKKRVISILSRLNGFSHLGTGL